MVIATEKANRKNMEIRVPRVRVIGADGKGGGGLARQKPKRKGKAPGWVWYKTQPTADPPVCRIMDFGKFKFEMQKKAHAAKRKTKQVEIKELKFRPSTEDGDYNVKMRNMKRFLEEGDKVKVVVRFKGREMAHTELGEQMVKRIQADIVNESVIESFPRFEGRQMVMMVAPKKK